MHRDQQRFDHELVSIIIPVYNVEQYLARCIDSVLSQSYKNLEVILVDDKSTDSSGAICDHYSSQHEYITTIHSSFNQGLSAARNIGLNHMTGEYVLFLDSDDCIGKYHVENLQNAIKETGCPVAVTGFQTIRDDQKLGDIKNYENIKSFSTTYDVNTALEKLLLYDSLFSVSAWGKLYSKQFRELLRFPVGRIHEDVFVTYKAFNEAGCVAYENANDYFYTMGRPGSITVNRGLETLDVLDAINEMRVYFADRNPSAIPIADARWAEEVMTAYLHLVQVEQDDRIIDNLFSEMKSTRSWAVKSHRVNPRTRQKYLLTYLGQSFFNCIVSSHQRNK